MSWLLLGAVILTEVLGTTSMKLSEGFSRPSYSALVVLFYAASFAGFGFVLKRMDIGVAYAVWAGLGTALIAAVGVFAFGEALSAVKVTAIALIVVGVVTLELAGAH
jgi:small multidrug resistance pump